MVYAEIYADVSIEMDWFLWIRFEYRKWFWLTSIKREDFAMQLVTNFKKVETPKKQDWRQIKLFLMFSSKKWSFPMLFVVIHLTEVFFYSRVQFILYENMNLLNFCKIFFCQSRRCFWGFPEKITQPFRLRNLFAILTSFAKPKFQCQSITISWQNPTPLRRHLDFRLVMLRQQFFVYIYVAVA